jgi:hypothetical protein
LCNNQGLIPITNSQKRPAKSLCHLLQLADATRALQHATRAHQWLQRAPPLKMAAPALMPPAPTNGCSEHPFKNGSTCPALFLPHSITPRARPCSEPLLIPTPIQVQEQQPFLLPMAAGADAQLLSMAEAPPDHVQQGSPPPQVLGCTMAELELSIPSRHL